MTSCNVAYLVTALCHQISVTRRITPHSLRHSAVTLALDAGVGLRDVQDVARRTDPKTTRSYDRSRNQLGPPCHLRDRPVPRRRQRTPALRCGDVGVPAYDEPSSGGGTAIEEHAHSCTPRGTL